MVFALAFVVILALLQWVLFQGYSLAWTGFPDYITPTGEYIRGKTLWDWMELFIIPIFLASGAFYLNRSERESERRRAEERSTLEREIATDRQQEAALQAYLDRMADLLLNENLQEAANEKLRNVARIRTLTVLRGLDAKRKGIVLLFLYESGLISGKPVIDLAGADLSEADLFGANLTEANLGQANLTRANLSFAHLDLAILDRTNLSEANLGMAHLDRALLERANLSKAQLGTAHLTKANLSAAILTEANLSYFIRKDRITYLLGANLSGANLRGANMSGANLRNANLSGADLSGANLVKSSWLSIPVDADLHDVDLSRANLNEAKISNEQIASVKSLKGAIMPDGTKHD
jgi:uncharacterized protein YjbI with pentapeptide repeats